MTDNEPVPAARTAEEQDLIKTWERMKGSPLTEQEINLWIEQAKMIGDL